MSFTLGTLKTAIQDYLEVSESTFTTQLPTFIKEAEDRIFSFVQLPEQRKNVQGTVTTGNRFLATPTDFYSPMSLAIISSDTYDYLDFKHPSFIKEYSSGTTRATPKYYSLLMTQLLRFHLSQMRITQWNFIIYTNQYLLPMVVTAVQLFYLQIIQTLYCMDRW